MITQSRHIGEQWTQVRDNLDRGISRDDARELLHITKIEFQPPSKAHLKRLRRDRPVIVVKSRKPAPDKPQNRALNATRSRALDIVAINNPHKAAARLGKTSEMFRTKRPEPVPPPPVVIAGLLPNYHVPPKPKRLEPFYGVAADLIRVMATVYGPLTRRQQADYAFTVAQYGDIIYA